MSDQQQTPSTSPQANSTSPPTTSPPTSASTSQKTQEIPTLRPQRQKPTFRLPTSEQGPSSLSDRLKQFLPQMAAANEELAQLEKEGKLEGNRYEDVEEGKEFVEMELGLGVLEEKGTHDSDGDSSSSEESDEEDGDSSEDGANGEETQMPFRRKADGDGGCEKERSQEEKEKDVLGRLMGLKRGRNGDGSVGIQEVGE